MRKRLPAWLALMIITVIAAACLALTNELTKGTIAAQEQLKAEQARKSLLPQAETFEELETEGTNLLAFHAGKKGDEIIGYVATQEAKGFAGPIEVTVAVDGEALVKGISVGGPLFQETAGLGAKAKEPAFTDQYKDRQTPLKVIKPGAERTEKTIDAITASTISSSAVTGAVNDIGFFMKEYLGLNKEDEMVAGSPTAKGVAKGFAGQVAVTITLDKNNAITEITIGDENFMETDGFGSQMLDPEYAKKYIGKVTPMQYGDVEVIAGVTITSHAVVDAINDAHVKIKSNAGASNKAKASAKGFAGQVAVTVTIDEKGAISEFVVGDDNFMETDGFGTKVLEESYTSKFIGKTFPLTTDQVEVISGVTITSNAVIEAANLAYEKIKSNAVPTNKAKASAKGFAGQVAVTVTIDEKGAISEFVVGDDNFMETDGFGTKALEESYTSKFIGKTFPLTADQVEVISGVTITSNAVLEAANKAYEKIQANQSATPPTSTETEKPATVPSLVGGDPLTASTKGFVGPVAVTITVTEDGKIASLVVGDSSFAETQGFGTQAKDEAYTSKFIGKSLPLAKGDIELIVGSTITSQAVVDAVNLAFNNAQ